MIKRKIIYSFIFIVILCGLIYAANHFTIIPRDSAEKGLTLNSDINKSELIQNIQLNISSTTKTRDNKINILIVPGHESNYGGAKFGNIYERNLVADIGKDLSDFLKSDSNYTVSMTRDTKSWTTFFSNYFNNNWNQIIKWEKIAAKSASKLTSVGVQTLPPMIHITAPTNVALRLYGITKWANENKIDLMIHLHLNDYPGHSSKVAGKYSGLVIYTPAQQYSNSTTTKEIANAVFNRLALYNPTSNLPAESDGVVDDPELIAVGANNTSDAASMLIEYDYLYEPQFVNPKVRSLALNDLAYQTYLGLQDFYNNNTEVNATSSYEPKLLYDWKKPVTGKNSNPKDIYAMQTALIMDGDYPPVGKSKNDCPHSGIIGSCTNAALKAFQKKYLIIGESMGGNKTFNKLNSIYLNK